MEKIFPAPPRPTNSPYPLTNPSPVPFTTVSCSTEYVLANVSHYLMFAFSDSHRSLDRIEDGETRQLLKLGLRAMQIAWGQADALASAVENRAGQ